MGLLKMALPYRYTGTVSRSAGIFSALAKNAKLLNLKPAQRINFTFDPFGEDVLSIRKVLHYFYQDRVRDTNPKCILKTTVVSDRTPPNIEIKLDDNTLLFKTSNLSDLEILKQYNALVSSRVVEDSEPAVTTLGKPTKKKK